MTAQLDRQLVSLFKAALADALSVREFVVAEPLDPTWGYWFINASNTAPTVVSGVAAGFSQDRYGGIAIAGHVAIQSKRVNEILSELPEESRLERESVDYLRRSFIDICGFGNFQDPPYTGLTHVITEVDHVESAVRWFIDFIDDHALPWLSERDSQNKLTILARTPSPRAPENISPRRLRAVVVLCIVNKDFADAASLVEWYIRRNKFNPLDSLERTLAFDAALSELYPQYKAERGRMGN